jgi:hypothetical protein
VFTLRTGANPYKVFAKARITAYTNASKLKLVDCYLGKILS